MRFTYIKDDKVVGIGGKFLNIDNSTFDQEVDAIQWYETWGEIEFINRQERNNEKFEDISYIQPLIDAWEHKNESLETDPIVTDVIAENI
jgi:hypothetical protein